MTRAVAVIQARMNSKRLPGKVLLPLADAPMLQRLIERVRGAKSLAGVVVATSAGRQDDAIADLCDAIDVDCHRGPEDDVLRRVVDAAESQHADCVVRLTADNPFVDGSLIDFMLDCYDRANPRADYLHNVDGCDFPFGLFVEICTMPALREGLNSDDALDREHVTWFVRRRPERFRHVAVRAPFAFAESRLSIDTVEDYQRLKPLFESMYRKNPSFGFRALALTASMH